MDGALTGKEGSSARPSVRFEVNLIAKSEACLIEIIPWEVLPSCSLTEGAKKSSLWPLWS